MHTFAKEIENHLKQALIPFWENLKDEENGGYYGYMDYDLKVDRHYDKGCILNSRILWFFSNAYLLLGEEKLRADADHAYEFLRDHCVDRKFGGIFWSVAFDGTPKDETKHTYNQAFAIYALSSYYDATGNQEALKLATRIQRVIEEKCTDAYGYLEAFDRKFEPQENHKLSENGVLAEKTMNTLLHVLEAYTEFYRVTKDEMTGQRLRFMMDIFIEKIYDQKLGRQEVFFDRTWNSLVDLYSYGHDIESAWLMDRALAVLGDKNYTEKLSPITRDITEHIYLRAYHSHSLLNECENGVDDTTRVWWVQAEGIVGFLNGYEKQPERKEYLAAAEQIWDYIKEFMIDKRKDSEWYWCVDESGRPIHKPIVEPWKCPYHNGRMCMEVIRRTKNAS